MPLLLTAVVLLLVPSLPIAGPGGAPPVAAAYLSLDSGQGGTPASRRPMLVHPGDPPPCFDVVIGPIRPRPTEEVPSPVELGCVVEVLAAADAKGSLYSDGGPDWDGYTPVAERSGMTATWADVVKRTSFFVDVDAVSGPGQSFSRGQFCLESAVAGEYYVAVSAPADALRGQPLVASEEPEPEAVATPRIHSRAFWLRFGPPPAELTERDVQALLDRAERLGPPEDVLRWYLQMLALHPDTHVWLFGVGRAYLDLGRAAEALPYLERSMAACEQTPGCRERSDKYGEALGLVQSIRESMP